jgi:2-dehydro-3-deoxygluconokinase
MGLYFLETGAVTRPSKITYDRANSAFVTHDPDNLDWPLLLKGIDHVHISGITPATGPAGAQSSQALALHCANSGIGLSFDGNYREELWKTWANDGPAILRSILEQAKIAFINERDIALVLDKKLEQREAAIQQAFGAFPNLQYIAATTRLQTSVGNQTLTGQLYTRETSVVSRRYDLESVIDRIGGGDAFAAGILHALFNDCALQSIVDYATAAATLKHSIHGDFNLVTPQEVTDLVEGQSLDVKR